MKRDHNSAKRLAGHISVVGMVVVLFLGLLLENCFETCTQNLPGSERLKGVSAEPAVQLPSKIQETPKDTFLSGNKELSIPSASEVLSIDKTSEKQQQEQITSSSQEQNSSITVTPNQLTVQVEKSAGEETILERPSEVKQRSAQSKSPLRQSKSLALNRQEAKQRKKHRQETLQGKESRLLNEIFKTSQGYIVKFYKGEAGWRAIVVGEIGHFRREVDLPAYLGKGEDLESNIEQLLAMNNLGKSKTTSLIQVILPSGEKGGYVYVGSLWGGGKHKRTKGKSSSFESPKKKARTQRGQGSAKKEKKQSEEKEEKKKFRTKRITPRGEKRKKKSPRESFEKGVKPKAKKGRVDEGKLSGDEEDEEEKKGSSDDTASIDNTKDEEGEGKRRFWRRRTRSVTKNEQLKAAEKQAAQLEKERKTRKKIVMEVGGSEETVQSAFEKAQQGDVEAQYKWAQYLLGQCEALLKKRGSKIGKSNKKLSEAIEWYAKAVYGGSQEAVSMLKQLKTILPLEKFQIHKQVRQKLDAYKEFATTGDAQAQKLLIVLRDSGFYRNVDEESMNWYKQAVENAAKFGLRLTFKQFTERARKNSSEFEADYQQRSTPVNSPVKVSKKNPKTTKKAAKEHTRRPPMRISDLIVMPLLDADQVPTRIEWGGDYTAPEKAHADSIFAPLFVTNDKRDYEDVVMSIDPSGGGNDETAYCVAKRSGDYYFIVKVGGLAGSYNDQSSIKTKKGNSNKVLKELLKIARENKVTKIFVENNNDKSFGKLLQMKLGGSKKGDLEIISQQTTENKEKRIIDRLQPLLSEHKLIIDKKTLREDFDPTVIQALNYKFFYQLMTIVENAKNSKSYLDGKKPIHDDRVDAVADAIHYLREEKRNLDEFNEFKEHVQREDPEACCRIGNCFRYGVGTKANYEEAQQWFEIAAKLGSPEAQYSLAWMYQHGLVDVAEERKQEEEKKGEKKKKEQEEDKKKGKEKEQKGKKKKKGEKELGGKGGEKSRAERLASAIELYQQAASKGEPSALYELAKLYQQGAEGIEQNLEEAQSLFKAAADKKHLGAMYEWGKAQANQEEGVTAELYKEIVQLYQESVKLKEAAIQAHQKVIKPYRKAIQVKQGQGSSSGGGMEKNLIEFYQPLIEWRHNLADEGYANAIYELGEMNRKGIADGKPDYKKAYEYFKEAVQVGHVGAATRLGDMLYQGDGLEQNYRKAFRYYYIGARRKDKRAQYQVAIMYLNGQGVKKKDERKAFKYFKAAAKQGVVEAQFEVGRMYEEGIGTKVDYNEARGWYRKAADENHVEAQFNLARMCRSGIGGDIDISKAIELYQEIAAKGHADANIQLGELYDRGEGVEKDINTALGYYRRGAELKRKGTKG